MSPVIYRPAGSGPDREPEQPPRVSIAGPGIPTAASFADDTTAPAAPPSAPPGPAEPVDLGDDPEIDDTEIDHTEIDEVPAPVAPPTPAATPSFTGRRPSLQKRRRRILGRSHGDPAPEPPPEAAVPDPRPDEPQPDEPADTAAVDESVLPAPAKRIEELADQPAPPRPRRVRTLHISAPPVGPALGDDLEPEHEAEPVADAATHEPPMAVEPAIEPAIEAAATISGHVLSTRGRGLSGITVVVVDPDDQVVGTTVTGRRGQFVVDHLPAGTYRLGARDAVDGDFVDSWHGGTDAAQGAELRLDDDGTAADTDVILIGRVAIAAIVDASPTEVVVGITVLDRSTGMPGSGAVTVSTDQFRAQLPLTDGHASITLFSPGVPRLRVEYPGSAHTSPAKRTIRLR